MTIIKLCGQQLKLSAPVIAADTIDYIEMAVDMSEDWQRMDAVFVRFELDNYYVEAQVRDGKIRKEQHLNLTRGSWRVSAYGVRSSGEDIIERITSTTASLDVKVTGAHGGEPLPPDSQGVIERLKAQIAGKLDKQQDAKDAGKVLGIDDEGRVVPVEGGGGSAGEPGKPALIGSNGNWLIWDIERGEYVDSGKPSRGADGAPLTVVGRTHVVAETVIYPDGTIFDRRPAYDILTLSDGTVLDIPPGTNGTKGADGVNGLTPYVGSNGNWWIPVPGLPPSRGTDTGKPSRGEDGAPGATGPAGTSVSITNISENTESGGTSVVTFSDGKTLSVRNGLDGQGGSGSDVTADTVRGWGFAYKTEVDGLKEEIKSIEIGGTGLDSGKLYYLCKALKGALFDSAEASNAAQAFIASVTGESEPEIPDEPAEITLTGITAVYSGGDVLEGTQASDIDGITVTAHYSDGTTEVINTWSITGIVAVGQNTFTITYRDKSATVTVNGIAEQSTTWEDVEMEVLTASANNITDVYAGADTASTNIRTRANGLHSKISAEVFDRDTKVKMAYTATGTNAANNKLYCGCFRYSKDTMIDSDNHNVFYGVTVANGVASGASGEYEYTVKAGYRLAIVNQLGGEFFSVIIKKEVI